MKKYICYIILMIGLAIFAHHLHFHKQTMKMYFTRSENLK